MNRIAGPIRPALARRLAILLFLGLALGLWLRRPALVLYHLEAGGQALAGAAEFQAAHPAAENRLLDLALNHFQRAVELAPGDGFAYRRLGEAWLLAGNNSSAEQALSRAAQLRPYNPMMHIELGQAWSGLGQADNAVTEYEKGRYGPATSEAVINYLKQADWRIAAGSGDVALGILQDKVLALDPGNLPALQRIAAIYQGIGQEGPASAAPIRLSLQQFSERSVAVPSSLPQATYLAQAMAALTENGTWSRETLLDVVAYQVWQFATGPSGQQTERILQTLLEHWPDDADLRFYLAEFYHRRNDLGAAEAGYREVLRENPEYRSAVIRLGMVNRVRGQEPATTEQATVWCQLESEVSDPIAVATALAVPVSQVQLGTDLLVSGLETYQGPTPTAGWHYDVYPGKAGNRGLFVEGSDDLALAGSSLRIDSLWPAQSQPDTSAFAEYTRMVMAGPGKYLVSVRYSLERAGATAGIIDWYDSSVPNSAALLYAELPPTRQCVSTVRRIVDGPVHAAQTAFLLRHRGAGSLSTAGVSIRPITIAAPGPIENTGNN